MKSMSTVALSPASLSAPVATGSPKHSTDDDFTFDDLISIVNPLQHIPVVSTIYRSLTGDTIKPFERIVGDTLYGGVWGCVSAVANVVYQDVTGKDFGQTVLDTALDLVNGGDDDAQATTANDSSSTTNTTAAATPASLNPGVSTATMQPASLPAPATTPATSIANGPPQALQSPMPSTSPSDAATIALMHAMSNKGIDPTLSQRALSAYKKSLAPPQPQQPPAAAVPTS